MQQTNKHQPIITTSHFSMDSYTWHFQIATIDTAKIHSLICEKKLQTHKSNSLIPLYKHTIQINGRGMHQVNKRRGKKANTESERHLRIPFECTMKSTYTESLFSIWMCKQSKQNVMCGIEIKKKRKKKETRNKRRDVKQDEILLKYSFNLM